MLIIAVLFLSMDVHADENRDSTKHQESFIRAFFRDVIQDWNWEKFGELSSISLRESAPNKVIKDKFEIYSKWGSFKSYKITKIDEVDSGGEFVIFFSESLVEFSKTSVVFHLRLIKNKQSEDFKIIEFRTSEPEKYRE